MPGDAAGFQVGCLPRFAVRPSVLRDLAARSAHPHASGLILRYRVRRKNVQLLSKIAVLNHILFADPNAVLAWCSERGGLLRRKGRMKGLLGGVSATTPASFRR